MIHHLHIIHQKPPVVFSKKSWILQLSKKDFNKDVLVNLIAFFQTAVTMEISKRLLMKQRFWVNESTFLSGIFNIVFLRSYTPLLNPFVPNAPFL